MSFKIAGTCFDISAADGKSPLSPGGSVGYWLIDDLEELLARVNELGGKVYRGPSGVHEVQRTIVQIQDPFGDVIGFEVPFWLSFQIVTLDGEAMRWFFRCNEK